MVRHPSNVMQTLPCLDEHAQSGKKRIIVCCDGTWMDSDGAYQVPSNVTRLARSLKPYGIDESGHVIPQVVFYQNGIGTGSKSLYTKYVGGATGEGLAANIREAYNFICLNYNHGDEIFLIGFSRGAFTARSISSIIADVGLLTANGMEHFDSIFEDWEYQNKRGWKPKFPNTPWPGHAPPVLAPEYQKHLLELELTRPNIPIKAVAVWDTVGGLGIPVIGILPQPPSRDFAFVNTKAAKNVEYAFQALALDERRRSFYPTVWEKPEGQELPRVLKQCWFPGVHSDVGGSYQDTDLANLTLCWMVSQLDSLLDFEHDRIWRQVRLSIERHQDANGKPLSASSPTPPPTYLSQVYQRSPTSPQTYIRPWGLGKIHNSMTPFFRLGGSVIRTPGEFTEAASDSDSQQGMLWYVIRKAMLGIARRVSKAHDPTPKRYLTGTNETIHSSVRIRMGKKGLGYNDKGSYDSEAMKGWTMYGIETMPDTPTQQLLPGAPGQMKEVVWRKEIASKDGRGNNTTRVLEMAEDVLGPFERTILRLWPEIDREFDYVKPGGHKQNVKRANTLPITMLLGDQRDNKSNDRTSKQELKQVESTTREGGVSLSLVCSTDVAPPRTPPLRIGTL